MSRETFDDNDPLNRPVFIDIKSGRVLPPDDPIMKKIDAVWAKTTIEQRRAWFEVTVKNSRDPLSLMLVEGLVDQFKT